MASSKIVLTSSSDWRPWLFIIKSLALGGNVWKYIDPDLASPLPEPTLPTSPEAIEASPVARHTTLATLTPDERDVFKLLYNEYKEKLSQVKAEIESLKLIRTHLVTSVSKENVVYIESKEGIHDMLVALKKRLAPTDEARKLEIIGKYNRLRTFDKRTDVETWCKEWETTYADAVALNLSEVSGNRSQSDFAMALSSIDQAYSTAQQFWLQQSLKSDSTTKVPSLYDIIEDFRNNYRSNQALKINSRVGAFSVLTDEKKEYQESKDSNAELKLLKPCLCGTQHKYKNCLYITPSERPQGWKGEREVFERINKKISSLKNRSGKPLKSWFLSTFKYDGFDDPPTYGKENNSKINTSPKSLGAFTTYSSFKTASSDDYKLYHSWTLDSASDVHICNDPTISDWVTTKEACAGDEIFAGKTSYAIEAFGTVTIEVITDEGIALMQLQDVALAPGFMTNLVSLDRLNSKGVHWNSEYPTVLKRDQKPFCKLRRVGRHWTLQKDVRQKNIFNSFSTNSSHVPRTVKFTAKELHSVLAHASTQAINHVDSSDISIDYSVPCPTSSECETCSLAKAKKQISRRKEVEFESNGLPFFRIGWDMIEFEQAFNGDNYGSHIRCRDSGFEFSGTHPTKPGALAFFKKTVIFIQNTLRFKIHFCRLDGETTFGIEFEEFVAEQGIVAERTAPYSAEQNGGVERSGGIIVVKTRSFIIGANLPSRLWNEAFNAATYIKNRTPHHQLDWKTPFEVIFKNKPTYAHMHPYGCRAYALEHKIPRRQKMQPRAHIGYLVGYDSRNIYRIWIPSKKRVVRTRDVTFDHKSFWSADDLDIGDVLRESADEIINILDIPQHDVQQLTEEDDIMEIFDTTCETTTPSNEISDITKQSQQLQPHRKSPEISLAPSDMKSQDQPKDIFLDGDNSDSRDGSKITDKIGSRKFQGIDPINILKGKRHGRSAYIAKNIASLAGYHYAFSSALRNPEQLRIHRKSLPQAPRSFNQIKNHIHAPQFKQACDKEIRDLFDKKMFEYVKEEMVPKDENILPLMWVLSYKFDEDGYLDRHKARIVARGDLEFNQDDTYASTLALQTFRAMVAVASAFDLEIKQYDAVNAFANAKLPRPVYCRCPEGYTKEGYVMIAQKAIYGLKNSPLLWYNEITLGFKRLGLFLVPETSCLFKNDWLYVMIYVDDLILMYRPQDSAKFKIFEDQLLTLYEFRVIGNAKHFLGIRIIRNREERKLWLIQDSYIGKLAEKFNIKLDKIPKTPLPLRVDWSPWDGTATLDEISAYQQRVGSLGFSACATRPDISKAVSYLSEVLQNPSPEQAKAAEHCLHYLIGNKYLGLQYDGLAQSQSVFTAYSDSAFADNPINRYSSHGFCFSLYGGPIHWKAVKGKTVTLSSTEAELLAITFTAKEFIGWIRFFSYLNFDLQEKPVIYCDNVQTIRLLTKDTPKLDTALRHVDIHQNWLRQEVQLGHIQVEWIKTQDMVADGLTKILPCLKHSEFIQQLNLIDIQDMITANCDTK